jgi:DNA-binding NarL/FixJ family response regulator
VASAIDRGQDAFERQEWGEAYAELRAAEAEGALAPEDLERLGAAAYLTGRDDESEEFWNRAHQGALQAEDAAHAARCAFWLAFTLFFRGEAARSAGWVTRGERVLDDANLECAERGLLLIPAAIMALATGDASAAYERFSRVARIGERFRDPHATTVGRLGSGQGLIALGRTIEGVALLDEAMVAVTTAEVSPVAVGILYCAVLGTCSDIFDIRRAHEWTTALTRWCDSQPDLVPYRGQCLVHRSEVLQLHGEWPDAADEAARACERLLGHRALGAAHYQHAELDRLRGEFAAAEASYRAASECGQEPQPGLAQLRLAQGRLDAARASITRVLDAAPDRLARAKLLPAYVEIMLAAGETDAARAAGDELAGLAVDLDAPFLRSVAAHARGAVLLADGDARAASDALLQACRGWRDLEAPYEAARARALLALAYRAIGDEEAAGMEFDAASNAFAELGAIPDAARVEQLRGSATVAAAGGLTGRELQVLALLATGRSNHEMAMELSISDHTVRRHLQNIFTKLGVSSRAAATAYAFQHDLV